MSELHECDCQHVLDVVHAFLDEEIADDLAESVRYHLLACEECVANYDCYAELKAAISRCGHAEQAPARLRIAVTQIIETYRG